MIRWAIPPAVILTAAFILPATACTWGFGGGSDVPPMHRQFSRTVDIQTGVVLGDLDRAREAGSWLLSQDAGASTAGGAGIYREAMRDHAATIAEAEDLDVVTVEVGRLAASCGSCHQASNGGPRFVAGSDAPEGDSRGAQMILHLWAADRMWEGLVGPSEEAWQAGTRALSELAPTLGWAIRASESPGEASRILQALSRLASEAGKARGQEERGAAYGRILETCRRCHSLSGT